MESKSDCSDVSISVPLLAGYDETQQINIKLVDGGQVHQADVVVVVDSGRRISVSGTTSFLKTTFHGLNALSGVGILSVPYALASGGWLSLTLLFLVACATFYTGLLIKRCMDIDPNITSYPDIGYRAFRTPGHVIVSVFMNLELYLVATGFLILAGDNLHSLLPEVELDFFGVEVGGRQSFTLLVGLIILPTVWLNNMSILSYISATAVLASLVILCSVFWGATFDGIGFEHKGTLLNWSGIPTAFSLYAFCYCAHPVFPTLYTSMKDQRQFSKVLLVCFSVCTVSYASMAVMGYLMFGSEIQSQITLNLPVDKFSSRLTIYTALVNPIAKYALMITPIIYNIEKQFRGYCNRRITSLMIRTSLVISSILVALAVPFFGYLMSLVGAFLSVTASILLPCLCYLKIAGTQRRIGMLEVVGAGFTVLTGIVVLITGTYTSLAEIIDHL